MATAGYSGTPLAKKLGIKAGASVVLVGAPDGFESTLEGLPDDAVVVSDRVTTGADVIVAFNTDRAELEAQIPTLLEHLDLDGGLWVAWPKRASKVPTDITEDVLREVFLPLGLVDNKVCAVDSMWSGLRLVWRKEERARRR